MKIFRNVMTGIAGLVLLLALISYFLPAGIHIEREMVIEAPVELVFEQVNDFRNWEKWSPWTKMAPDMINEYAGTASGVGHVHRWVSDHARVASGTQEIIESQPNRMIRIHTDFERQADGQSTWRFEEVEGGPGTSWTMDVHVGKSPASKYVGLLLDAMMGPLFERGLADMRDHTLLTYTQTPAGRAKAREAASDSLRASFTGL